MKLQLFLVCMALGAFTSPSSAQNYSPAPPGYLIPAADLSTEKAGPFCAMDEDSCSKTVLCCAGLKCVFDVDNQVYACEDDLLKHKHGKPKSMISH